MYPIMIFKNQSERWNDWTRGNPPFFRKGGGRIHLSLSLTHILPLVNLSALDQVAWERKREKKKSPMYIPLRKNTNISPHLSLLSPIFLYIDQMRQWNHSMVPILNHLCLLCIEREHVSNRLTGTKMSASKPNSNPMHREEAGWKSKRKKNTTK